MCKFKLLGLDDLRQNGINVGNDLVVKSIDKFIEDTVLHLLKEVDTPVYDLEANVYENKHWYTDPVVEEWRSTYSYIGLQWHLVEGCDIWLNIDMEIYGNFSRDGELDFIEVNFHELNLIWLENKFSMIGTKVEEICTLKVIDEL